MRASGPPSPPAAQRYEKTEDKAYVIPIPTMDAHMRAGVLCGDGYWRAATASIKPYLVAHARGVAMIGSAPDRMPTVIVADIDSGESHEVTATAGVTLGSQAPNPEVVDILARDGGRIYATLYRPRPEKSPAPVPVVVRAHPGPTSNAPLRLDPWVQFFVGHGFAVLDVDYRGSTGYGRAYRNALCGHRGRTEVPATSCRPAPGPNQHVAGPVLAPPRYHRPLPHPRLPR